MWFTLIVLIILGYYISQLEKRIRSIEETRGPGYSHSFSINALDAVFEHEEFGKLTSIKGALDRKEFSEWSMVDKERWQKNFAKQVASKTRIAINYLQSENAYLVRTFDGNHSIIKRGAHTNSIYSAIVLGDEDGFKDHIEFSVYERLIRDNQGKYIWVLTPCLEYNCEDILSEKNKFTPLCDFPIFTDLKDDDYRSLGFAIERRGGDDIYEDPFGVTQTISTQVEYKKDGVEFNYIF